jgi:hypothetical protein
MLNRLLGLKLFKPVEKIVLRGVVERIGTYPCDRAGEPPVTLMIKGIPTKYLFDSPYGSHVLRHSGHPVRQIALDWSLTQVGDEVELEVELGEEHTWLFQFTNKTLNAACPDTSIDRATIEQNIF